MTNLLITDALLREFLLGTLADEEHEQIESLFLTDSQVKGRVLLAEQDLIEDYLEESLDKDDLERFLARYAHTPKQSQKLRITRAIKDWAVTTQPLSRTEPVSVSLWDRLTRIQFKPAILVPIALTLLIAVMLAIVWLDSRRRESNAVQQELAQLNSPASLRETPSDMRSLELRPVTVRSSEPGNELELRNGTRIVEFRLPWIQKERFSVYQAKLRSVGRDDSFVIKNLQAETADGSYSVRLRFPSHLLHRGSYVVELTGLTADGQTSQTEEYTFTVNDR